MESLPSYLDPSAPVDTRVRDLVSRMTLSEKVSQMMNTAPAIERLGVPAYDWWNECLHGVARAGKATVFPQAIALAATFDTELMERVASVISDEARAKYHAAVKRGNRARYCGLTFWSPNVNIFRDPRWGRGQETYGEDPVLTGSMGEAFVRGLQGSHPRYLKTAACAKHYAVHSGPEQERHGFDAHASEKDLRETYLPAFKRLVDAGVESVMGAYNRTNGEACCASPRLLKEILRGEWKFSGHVVSDCGAIDDIHKHHRLTSGAQESVAAAVAAGCDLNCGCTYWSLVEAVKSGLVSEARIDECLHNLFRTRFKLGMFDPDEIVPYASIDPACVNSPPHVELARTTAARSIVLLKNDGILPLDQRRYKNLFMMGPGAATTEVLFGNYNGMSGTMVTILEGLVGAVDDGVSVYYKPGCLLAWEKANTVEWTVNEAADADAVIAVLGLSPLLENEEGDAIANSYAGDRRDIGLPPNQERYLRLVVERAAKAAKPVILVLTGGSAIAVPEDLLASLAAVLCVWYPGEQGGRAVADVLLGRSNPSGRMPVSCPRSVEDLPAYEDYDMSARTYRYMPGEPLFPFGFGLSYTSFAYSDMSLSSSRIRAGESIELEVRVSNTGPRAGREIAQLYLSDFEASCRTPRFALKAFRPIELEAGASAMVSFQITPSMMELVTEEGRAVIEPGAFRLWVGGASPTPRSVMLGAPPPLDAVFEVL